MKKLNVIDVFIIVLIVLSIAGMGVRLGVNAYLNEKNNSEYYLILKAEGVDPAKENALREGDEVFLYENSRHFGIISQVSFENYSDGEGTQNIKCDAMITVKVRGNNSGNGFMLEDGTYLYAGQNLNIKSEGYEGEILVMGINDKKD